MIKRVCIVLLAIIFLSMSVYAVGEKMQISTTKDTYLAGDNINLKVSLYDSQDKPISTNIKVLIGDAENMFVIDKTIPSNEFVDIPLGQGASAGYWKITANYNDISSTALFMIELNELVKFEIKDNILTVINTGNTRYSKTIQIVIGDTIGTKQIDLGVGESTSFRLVAPEGQYNIKVTDGKTSLTQGEVSLTGNAIGVLDTRQLESSPLTTGVKGEEAAYGADSLIARNNSFVYVFLFVIFGAAILLAIEKRYRKSAFKQQDSDS
jgi:hypothetical protein